MLDDARLTGRRHRRCNWVRFLTCCNDAEEEASSPHRRRPNLRCRRDPATGRVTFEASEDIPPSTELRVAFEDSPMGPDEPILSTTVAKMVAGT